MIILINFIKNLSFAKVHITIKTEKNVERRSARILEAIQQHNLILLTMHEYAVTFSRIKLKVGEGFVAFKYNRKYRIRVISTVKK